MSMNLPLGKMLSYSEILEDNVFRLIASLDLTPFEIQLGADLRQKVDKVETETESSSKDSDVGISPESTAPTE